MPVVLGVVVLVLVIYCWLADKSEGLTEDDKMEAWEVRKGYPSNTNQRGN